MKKYKYRLAIILFLGTIAILIVKPLQSTFVQFFSDEPFYRGKPASYWVTQAKKTTRWITPSSPPNRTGFQKLTDSLGITESVPGYTPQITELGWADRNAIPVLNELLKQDDREIRIAAALTLASMNPPAPEAIPALIDGAMRKHAVEIVRYKCLWALRDCGPMARAATPMLQELLAETDKDLRAAAAEALQSIDAELAERVGAFRFIPR